jgi:hypothetical protein
MVSFHVQEGDTVFRLKQMVFNHDGIPVDQQKLVCNGRQMTPDTSTIEEYNVQESSVIHVLLRLRGGARTGGRYPRIDDPRRLQHEARRQARRAQDDAPRRRERSTRPGFFWLKGRFQPAPSA